MKAMLLLCLASCLLVAFADAKRTIVYKVVKGYYGTYSYLAAGAICEREGEGWTLAMPKKPAQNKKITALAKEKKAVPFWIGLDDILGTEGVFWWNDGKRLLQRGRKSWTNWATNEPNNGDGHDDCVQVNSYGQWSVDRCDVNMSFVCQKITR